MIEEFEHTGFWYLPEKPEKRVSGTLRFTPATGAVLDLIGYFEDERPPTSPLAPEIILGQSSDGREVTLRGCRELDRWLGSTPVQTSRFVAEMVLTGAHFAKVGLMKFRSLCVRYAHLDEWAGLRGFSFEYPGQPPLSDGIVVKYERPRSVGVQIPGGYTLEIGADFSCPMHARRVTVEQSTTMAIEHSQDRSLDEFLRVARRLEAFLSLAANEPCPPTRIKGILGVPAHEGGPRAGTGMDIGYRLGDVPGARKELIPEDMLFTLPDIGGRLSCILGNWIAAAEALEPVWGAYLGTLYNRGMYLPDRFLSMARAVEAYHRMRYSRRSCFQNRLAQICEAHAPLLSSLKVRAESFVQSVVQTRNYLTHLDAKLQKHAARGEELHRLGLNLKILLEACLLTEIGFSEDEMMRLFKRNRRYGQLMEPAV